MKISVVIECGDAMYANSVVLAESVDDHEIERCASALMDGAVITMLHVLRDRRNMPDTVPSCGSMFD